MDRANFIKKYEFFYKIFFKRIKVKRLEIKED